MSALRALDRADTRLVDAIRRRQGAYIGTVPSKKRVIRICEAICEMTGRDQTLLDQEMVVGKLNRTMIRRTHYSCLGPVSTAYRAVEKHAGKRLRQWLCAEHKVLWPGTKRFPEGSRTKRWASSVLPSGRAISRGRHRETLLREPDAANPRVRFDEHPAPIRHSAVYALNPDL